MEYEILIDLTEGDESCKRYNIYCYHLSKKVGVIHSLIRIDGRAWLESIKVESNFRNNKIGTNLLRIFENLCIEKSVNEINGVFRPFGEKPIKVFKFYQKNGYSVSDRAELSKTNLKINDLSNLEFKVSDEQEIEK